MTQNKKIEARAYKFHGGVVGLIDQNCRQNNSNKLLAHRPHSHNALKGKPVHKT